MVRKREFTSSHPRSTSSVVPRLIVHYRLEGKGLRSEIRSGTIEEQVNQS
jgi:hypothetical protein